ncbi:MAG: protein translocase subunit SecF [Legionellales bacterium]|nr:protein translocase subunit SecF [Legionellales bacterium]
MEFFRHTTDIDFMGLKNRALALSGITFIVCVLSVAVYGLNLGLDFTGGTQYEFTLHPNTHIEQVRDALTQSGFTDAQVQTTGGQKQALVRIGSHHDQDAVDQKAVVTDSLINLANLDKNEFIGPQVGQEMLLNGVAAVIISILFTMLYIMFRFEYRFAISAALALVHDPIVILGLFSVLQIEFNLISLAALLTVLGYSLNDTIVVYDRIRENIQHDHESDIATIVNHAINQTLSRTIITSGLTLLVVLALYIWGGDTLEGFSLALIIGIVVGTYSSIYIAGAFAVILGLDRDAFDDKLKQHYHRP